MSNPRFLPATLRPVLTVLLLTLASFGVAPRALAQLSTANPPERMSYQGFLADGNGVALATNAPKNYDVIFRMYNEPTASAPANLIWSEQQSVTVDKGYYSILLGEGTQVGAEPRFDLSAAFTNSTASDRYMEMTVKGIGSGGADVKILPRLRLLSSPYAYLARSATKIVSSTGGDLITTSGTNVNIAGKLSDNALSANVALYNRAGNFSALQSFSAGVFLNAASGYAQSSFGNFSIDAPNVFGGRFIVLGNGNVGIGVTAPINKLEVGLNQVIGNSTVGTSQHDNANRGTKVSFGYNSFGNDFVGMRSVIAAGTAGCGNSGDISFDTWECQTSNSREVMRINGRGNVGIGTATPTQAKLVVNGVSAFPHGENVGAHYTLSGGGLSGLNNSTYYLTDISIKASQMIHASAFRAFSDARIKNVQRRSDAATDLVTLNRIEITDYTFKDVIGSGNRPHKKVIGQQVEKVFPQAVTPTVDVVPDIYKKGSVKDGWVQAATDLKVGERVRLIGDKEEGIYEVLEVKEGTFRTEFKPATENVFVFGREVKDFRAVDYEAISMLNVSATQELARRVEKLEKRETRVAELEQKAARVATLEQEVAELKRMVAELAAANRGSKKVALGEVPAVSAVSLKR